ncbi:hypothetical protein U1Q18_019145 [Sarracenia purpurea var. burkii]
MMMMMMMMMADRIYQNPQVNSLSEEIIIWCGTSAQGRGAEESRQRGSRSTGAETRNGVGIGYWICLIPASFGGTNGGGAEAYSGEIRRVLRSDQSKCGSVHTEDSILRDNIHPLLGENGTIGRMEKSSSTKLERASGLCYTHAKYGGFP